MSFRIFNYNGLIKTIICKKSPVIPISLFAPKIIKHEFSTFPRILYDLKNKNKIDLDPINKSKLKRTIEPVEVFHKPIEPKSINSTDKSNNSTATSKPKIIDNIYTLPNFLTVTRIVTSPFIGYFIIKQESNLAILIFLYSCFTDFIDGFIARKFNQKSILGTIIDPLADKLLMTICTLSLAYTESIPTYLAALIIGRDVMLSLMSFYYRYISLPYPKTFKRFIDLSIPSVTVHPNLLSKFNTAFQMLYIGSLVLKPGVESYFLNDLWVCNLNLYLSGLELLVSVTTVLSGLTYIFSRKAVKFINNSTS